MGCCAAQNQSLTDGLNESLVKEIGKGPGNSMLVRRRVFQDPECITVPFVGYRCR